MMYDIFIMFLLWYGIGFIATMIGNALDNIHRGNRIDRFTADDLVSLIKYPFLGVITVVLVIIMAFEVIRERLKRLDFEFYLFGKPKKNTEDEKNHRVFF